MHNHLLLKRLLDRREKWQNETIAKMQEQLKSHPAGKYLVADYNRSLVVVYGNTQIGKTSLILNIMGVLPEYQHEVYTVLRAGQDYGDSSTVTAIFYLISKNDSYGISYSEDSTDDNSSYTDEEMIQHLSEIRKGIESGTAKYRLLYIFIPRKYFSKDILDHDSFSILDLPGINSKNEKEREHVDDVIKQYMAMATAKIIVTKGDSIQDLESISVPDEIDWRLFPNRYFIVVTMAFSQGSVKKYFSTDKHKRNISFIENVEHAFAEIPEIVRSEKIEWYPIDIGESYRSLISDYKDDADEIANAQNYFLKKIRDAITTRRGNGLKNIIHDLTVFCRDYYRFKIEKTQERIKLLEEDIEYKNDRLKDIRGQKSILQSRINQYTPEKIKSFRNIENVSLDTISNSIEKKIQILSYNIAGTFPERFYDHDKVIIKQYISLVRSCVEEYNALENILGKQYFNELFPEGINISIEMTDKKNGKPGIIKVSGKPERLCTRLDNIVCEQILQLEHLLRPDGFQVLLKKTNRSVIISVLSEMCVVWKKVLNDIISADVSELISKNKQESEQYYLQKSYLDNAIAEESSLLSSLADCQKQLNHEKRELGRWRRRETEDYRLLQQYLKLANSEYQKSKSIIKNEMKEKPLSERIQYLLLLGMMERDFNSLVRSQ